MLLIVAVILKFISMIYLQFQYSPFSAYYHRWRNLPKIMKYRIEDNVFSNFMGFQNASGNVLHGFGNFVIWILKSFGTVLEIF